MTSRYVPYATTPARLLGQLISDFVVGVWIAVWVVVGMAVHSAVAAIGDFGADIDSGASGIAGNLDEAGENASKVPLIGDALSSPLSAAGGFARDIAGAGHQLNTTATWLAWLLALAVAAPPILAIAGPWLVLRLRFFRRKWVALTLARTPAGEQLLALRALANRPLAKLVAVHEDPVGAWRSQDAGTITGLAALELRAAGVARTHR
ncbi:hypothetical protein [Mycobacterium sp. ITM-2016-00318]|uniref:hypothetical protein n=1 Tax=Mycobacterium sp. ITM-2016-00318 TaxID=2099693 RepID=UPI000CFA4647|nr:hypothetical protein [Mycobacterium sp. ITM-2016-00318]WNG92283.1 hypothetical protein C6A82_023195 [Mycobacterium sp. ITM-2016-00318]